MANSSRSDLVIRPLRPSDDSQIRSIIQKVMTELGANGPGFAIHDPEVLAMSETYGRSKSRYFVLVDRETGEKVVGGAGIAPLEGAGEEVCELRKMYFLPQARGIGWGEKMLVHCLEQARELGYRKCYLETLKSMENARKLYERHSFQRREQPMGATGHFGCDAWYEKALR